MKTPREVLLSRHESAESKLNAVRHQVMDNEVHHAVSSPAAQPTSVLTQAWLELVWSSKRLWLGFAAIWLLLGIVNIWTTWSPGDPVHAKTNVSPSPDVQMALLEQQRLRMELLEIPATTNQTDDDVKKPNSPRSQRESSIQTVQAVVLLRA